MKNLLYIFSFLTILLSVLFKIQHWPFYNELLLLVSSSLLFIILYTSYELRKTNYFLIPLFLSVTLVAAVFKLMRWPASLEIALFSHLLFIIGSAVVFYKNAVKLKNINVVLSLHLKLLSFFFIAHLLLGTIIRVIDIENSRMLGTLILSVFTLILIIKILFIKNLHKNFQNEFKILKMIAFFFIIQIFYISVLMSVQNSFKMDNFSTIEKQIKESNIKVEKQILEIDKNLESLNK